MHFTQFQFGIGIESDMLINQDDQSNGQLN